METRKLILLMIFSLSLIMLWDNYQKSIGNPTLFGMPTASAPAKPTANPLNGSGDPAKAAASNELPTGVEAKAPTAVQPDGAPAAVPAATVAPVKLVRVKSDVMELDFSTQGAQIVGSRLLAHPASAKLLTTPVSLFEQSPSRTYVNQMGLVGTPGLPNHRSAFEFVEGPTTLADGQDQLNLVFKSVGDGVELTHTFIVRRGKYAIDVKTDIKNLNAGPVAPNLYSQITRDANPMPDESHFYSTFTGPAFYSSEKKYQKVQFKDIENNKADFVKSSDTGWVALVQHYFVSAIVPQEGPRTNFTRKVDTNLYSAGIVASLGTIAPNQTLTYNSKVYTGPQDQHVLEKLSPGLELVVDYGWLTVIAKPIFWLLEQIHAYVGNWGWAIILLTVLIKAAFYPLSAASYKSMAKMRKVGPRMQKLKEQYGDDKMGFQRAMMDMYKREKINPLGGCMPILIQIPVFISLYWVLLASVEMRNAPWLGWITDLATPDPYYILPVVMAITMFVQTKLNPTPPDPMQAKLMMIMPLIFSFMFLFFPSGLVLYWVVNNMLSITQQWLITRQIDSGAAS